MRLSEAIREGAKLRPQVVDNGYFSATASCALGAAYEAVYHKTESSQAIVTTALRDDFPILLTRHYCPERRRCGAIYQASLKGIIVHLNDVHKMSREQIAGFVESIESEAQ